MNLPNQIAEPPELATSHYWESRATTAEEKVKEWSVRACEAEERVRKLEARWQDEIKIHLEAQHRIAKAREILEVTALDSESSWARIKAKEALEALEGK